MLWRDYCTGITELVSQSEWVLGHVMGWQAVQHRKGMYGYDGIVLVWVLDEVNIDDEDVDEQEW